MSGVYFSFWGIIHTHILIGVCFVIIAEVWCDYKERHRRFGVFSHDPFQLGEAKMWLKWYMIALIFFEVPTSCLYIHTGLFYWELAMSPIEAGLVVSGMFLTDRILCLWNTEPEAPTFTQRAKMWTERKAKSTKTAEERKQESDNIDKNFADVTRGH